jgi:hypothetical protein
VTSPQARVNPSGFSSTQPSPDEWLKTKGGLFLIDFYSDLPADVKRRGFLLVKGHSSNYNFTQAAVKHQLIQEVKIKEATSSATQPRLVRVAANNDLP